MYWPSNDRISAQKENGIKKKVSMQELISTSHQFTPPYTPQTSKMSKKTKKSSTRPSPKENKFVTTHYL